MTGEKSGWRSLFHVFDVHQLKALAVFLKQLHRVLTGVNDPEDVHFVADTVGLRFSHQQVEQSTISMLLKFIAVRVVEEFQAVFGQRLAGAIENRAGLATGLFIERVCVRNPGATGVLQAERLRIARNTLDVVAVSFKRKMPADRFEPLGGELFFEFLGREIVRAGQFDVLDPKVADQIERRRDTIAELGPQAVKLEADRSLEIGTHASRRFVSPEGRD
jgi:hypothetical protein